MVKYDYTWLEDRFNAWLSGEETEDLFESDDQNSYYKSEDRIEKLSPYNDPNYEAIINQMEEYLNGLRNGSSESNFSEIYEEDDDFCSFARRYNGTNPYACAREIPFVRGLSLHTDISSIVANSLGKYPVKVAIVPANFLKTNPIMRF
jgi:hypothetical protein